MSTTTPPDHTAPPVAALPPDLLAYHRHVLAQLNAAQLVARQWTAYLAQQYALAPGDVVADDGTFVRAARADAAPGEPA